MPVGELITVLCQFQHCIAKLFRSFVCHYHVRASHCEGHGLNKYLVQIVLIWIFDSKYIIWKATHESKAKEQVCVIGKQMLPLWKDKASKGEKDNCVCEARKRLMTGDCW